MEDSISIFSNALASFCNHLQTSCDALKQSVDRRPIPLAVTSDLSLLESMSFGTVSFEELLGHCNEVYKKNQSDLIQLEDRLKDFGYVPEEVVEIDYQDKHSSIPTALDLEDKDVLDLPSYCRPVSAVSSIMKNLEEDPLMDESLSLKSLGLSDVCLATLASEANNKIDDPDVFRRESMKHYGDKGYNIRNPDQNAVDILEVTEGKIEGDLQPAGTPGALIHVSKDDYGSLPSYMKSLTSWEDLLEAVEKINCRLRKKEKTKSGIYFHQDEIASLGLGPKARTYLLLLMRMNQLVVETIDGLISYKVLSTR
ncbi:hypothetical protein MANES_08G038400v8 [Manihot esculenta]|uniref:Uncharacterized protein n=1 Tax=Manihot esculenta TaxID=3983 RepID=A0ACB7H7T6_MANES|nr:hypothetical protein MANES_08G038400v8 [Manihot esculenta]